MSQGPSEPDELFDEEEVEPLVREMVEQLKVDPEEAAEYVDGRGTEAELAEDLEEQA